MTIFGKGKKTYKNYSVVKYGEPEEISREARYLNRKVRKQKLNDRKYFVWPVTGPLPSAILVMGRTN